MNHSPGALTDSWVLLKIVPRPQFHNETRSPPFQYQCNIPTSDTAPKATPTTPPIYPTQTFEALEEDVKEAAELEEADGLLEGGELPVTVGVTLNVEVRLVEVGTAVDSVRSADEDNVKISTRKF